MVSTEESNHWLYHGNAKGNMDETLALLCVARWTYATAHFFSVRERSVPDRHLRYHNKGVEHEHLLQMELALEARWLC